MSAMSMTFDNVNEALPILSQSLLQQEVCPSRAGNTREKLFVDICLTNPLRREITVPDRKASIAAQIVETVWVLSGRNDIAAIEPYLPRAGDFSDDGETWRAGYGARIRKWGGRRGTDQLQNVVELLRADPNTRRAVISIFDPAADMVESRDIPCNNWLHFIIRDDTLHLHVATRSNDLVWGWSGINQFEWSVLLEVVAGLVGAHVGTVNYSVTSFHSYARHDDRLRQMAAHNLAPKREGRRFRFSPKQGTVEYLDGLLRRWWGLEKAIREAGSSGTLAHKRSLDDRIQRFPEPMLRSWLWVIRWYWTGTEIYLKSIQETDLVVAALVGTRPKGARPKGAPTAPLREIVSRKAFAEKLDELHRVKHAAYGDSWKRRGEMLGIMANVARKIDRLGKTTDDETSADTAADLLIYLIKYRLWLVDEMGAPLPFGWTSIGVEVGSVISDQTAPVASVLLHLAENISPMEIRDNVGSQLQTWFDLSLIPAVEGQTERAAQLDTVLPVVFEMAYAEDRKLFAKEAWKAGNTTRVWKGYEA